MAWRAAVHLALLTDHAGWLRWVLGVTGEEEGSQCSVTVTAPLPPGNTVWERPTGCPAGREGPRAFVSQVTFLPEVKAAHAGWLKGVAVQAVGARLPLGSGWAAGRGWAVEEACEPPYSRVAPRAAQRPSPGAPCWSEDPAPSWVLSSCGRTQAGRVAGAVPPKSHSPALFERASSTACSVSTASGRRAGCQGRGSDSRSRGQAWGLRTPRESGALRPLVFLWAQRGCR